MVVFRSLLLRGLMGENESRSLLLVLKQRPTVRTQAPWHVISDTCDKLRDDGARK